MTDDKNRREEQKQDSLYQKLRDGMRETLERQRKAMDRSRHPGVRETPSMATKLQNRRDMREAAKAEREYQAWERSRYLGGQAQAKPQGRAQEPARQEKPARTQDRPMHVKVEPVREKVPVRARGRGRGM